MNIRGIIVSGLLALALVPAAAVAYDSYDYSNWEPDTDTWETDADSLDSDYYTEESDYDAEEYGEDVWGEDSEAYEEDEAWESDEEAYEEDSTWEEDAWESDEDAVESEDEEWEPESLNEFDGTYEYGDRLETWYSSEVAYHEQTDEWWIDDEGFYRTDEGYYVVAASDYEHGDIIDGSKGACIVLDDGCDPGVTDYYVAW